MRKFIIDNIQESTFNVQTFEDINNESDFTEKFSLEELKKVEI